MQAESRAVKAAALGVIGQDHLLARLPLTDLGRESFTYRKRVDDDPGNPRIAETAFAFDEDALDGRLLLVGLNNSTALSEAGAFRELGVDGLGGLLGTAVRGRGRADRLRPAPDGRPPVVHRPRQVRGGALSRRTGHGRLRERPPRRRARR